MPCVFQKIYECLGSELYYLLAFFNSKIKKSGFSFYQRNFSFDLI